MAPNYYERMLGLRRSPASERLRPKTTLPAPVKALPAEIVGPVRAPGSAWDGLPMGRELGRLAEAAETGETIIEMRECVARSGGEIKARSVEVTIAFGRELDLGSLLRGALSMMDFVRHRRAAPAPLIPVALPPAETTALRHLPHLR